MTPDMRCDCGARREAIEDARLDDREPNYIPGPLMEPCTCPRCVSCERKLEVADANGHVSPGGWRRSHATASMHPTCSNMDCALYGVWQLESGPAPGAAP